MPLCPFYRLTHIDECIHTCRETHSHLAGGEENGVQNGVRENGEGAWKIGVGRGKV